VAKARNFIERVPLAPTIAALFGVAAGVLVAATPQWLFEANVASSGIAALLPDAQPPLGIKARLLAIFVAAGLVATLVWLIVRAGETLLAGPQLRGEDDDLDLTAYAATLPERVRRPILAGDELGAPLMSDEALLTAAPRPPVLEAAADADAPDVGAYERDEVAPDAVSGPEPVVQLDAPEPVVDVENDLPVAAADDMPIPPARPSRDPVADDGSIEGLIRRLEAGLQRRDRPDRPPRGGLAADAAVRTAASWMVREGDAGDTRGSETVAALRRMAR